MNQPIDSSTVRVENELRGKVNRAGNEEKSRRGMTVVVMTGQEALILKMTSLKILPQLANYSSQGIRPR